MIKYSRWKGCEGVGVKKKRFERGETGKYIRREGGEMVGIKI